MGRLALRPALRAYAHAPAAAPAPSFANTKSMTTDGSDDGWKVALVGDPKATFFTAEGYTMSAWFKINDPPGLAGGGNYNNLFGLGEGLYDSQIMAGVGMSSSAYPWESSGTWYAVFRLYESMDLSSGLRYFHNGAQVVCMTGDAAGDGSGTAVWLHVAATSTTTGYGGDVGAHLIYMNGTPDTNSSSSTTAVASETLDLMSIGWFGGSGSAQYSPITMDHVSYWNKALDQTGVSALIDTSGGGSKPADLSDHDDAANLIAWYQIGEGSDSVGTGTGTGLLTDTQGNYNMTTEGIPAFSTDIPE